MLDITHSLKKIGENQVKESIKTLIGNQVRRMTTLGWQQWEEGEAERIEFTNALDHCTLRGWCHRPKNTSINGTIFLLHGFTCGYRWNIDDAKRFAADYGLASILWDARMHGDSDNGMLTFGYMESFDVEAAIRWAKENQLPRPYILRGESQGAMVARCAARRIPDIDGVELIQGPGNTKKAIEACIPIPPVSSAIISGINSVCGDDVVSKGHTDNMPLEPGCDPYLLEFIGRQDHFGYEEMKQAFESWPGEKAYNTHPYQTKATKLLFEFDVRHPGYEGDVYHQNDFKLAEDKFIRKMINAFNLHPATEGQIQDIWDHLNNTLWPHINDHLRTELSNLKKENVELKQKVNELKQTLQSLIDESYPKNK